MHVKQSIDRYGRQPMDAYQDRSQAIAALSATIETLGELQREASPQLAAQARLWSARAFLVQGRFDEALTRLTAVRQQRPFAAEAIVGALEEIELLADQARGVEMLQTTRYLMRELVDIHGFDATLITFEEFQRRLAGAIDRLGVTATSSTRSTLHGA